MHWDGSSLSAYGTTSIPDTGDYHSVSGTSATDLWAVGDGNLIVHNNGQGWVPVPTGQASTVNYRGVYASSVNDAWVVGNNGQNGTAVILHWDGSSFHAMTPPFTTEPLSAVSASGPNNVWIGGNGGVILNWNGSAFLNYTAAGLTGAPQINTVAAVSPTEVWFGGSPVIDSTSSLNTGCLLHWDGSGVKLLPKVPTVTLMAAAVAGSGDVWLAGYDDNAPAHGVALHVQNGVLALYQDFGLMYPKLYGIGARSSTDVWASGEAGTILHLGSATAFTAVPTGLPLSTLYGIAPAGASEMVTVGSQRDILRIFQ